MFHYDLPADAPALLARLCQQDLTQKTYVKRARALPVFAGQPGQYAVVARRRYLPIRLYVSLDTRVRCTCLTTVFEHRHFCEHVSAALIATNDPRAAGIRPGRLAAFMPPPKDDEPPADDVETAVAHLTSSNWPQRHAARETMLGWVLSHPATNASHLRSLAASELDTHEVLALIRHPAARTDAVVHDAILAREYIYNYAAVIFARVLEGARFWDLYWELIRRNLLDCAVELLDHPEVTERGGLTREALLPLLRSDDKQVRRRALLATTHLPADDVTLSPRSLPRRSAS